MARPEKETRENPEETFAAACIEAIRPGVMAVQHDDGSRNSMYDLSILSGGEVVGACEVTTAADGDMIELWNLANGRSERWIEPELVGGWALSLSPDCHFKTLKSKLPDFLAELEASDLAEAGDGSAPAHVENRLRDLGLAHARQRDTSYPGSVYFTIRPPVEMSTGFVASDGNELSLWLNSWLKEPAEQHNVEKVLASSAAEKHLFILFLLPPMSIAPFSVIDPLFRNDGPLPEVDLTLPEGVTHLWATGLWPSGVVFCWDRIAGWRKNQKPVLSDGS